ncbi:MAG: bifunctional methionine sulfoxide reductase B/A protein [Bacteroidetes bacterium]|nr:bifunctional methionine sulfoxide reductase B/A protein [Bacteroidota bacterium]
MKTAHFIKTIVFLLILVSLSSAGCTQTVKKKTTTMNLKKLTPEEARIILYKGTEAPFTGKYNNTFEKGTYVCKQCGAALYNSSAKFKSECGWPSFDDEIKNAVTHIPDADGKRTEIQCANCGAHLGHVFIGEGFTEKNTRHCVNSISIEFVPADAKKETLTETAIFAGGCFWGVEYYMQKAPGVISTEVGYIGGHTDHPTYRDVCSHTTGHAEAVKIIFNPKKTTFEAVARLFFEIHDPTQLNQQGPDKGDQYRTEIFYLNDDQKAIAHKLIGLLKDKGYKVVTKVTPATTFWKAEDYHQNYYEKEGAQPYCHVYKKKF